ncbi:hypothetical protein ACJMK2_030522 [Sinanodonta woodiana]|uniref:Folate receptor-like domain-containing protein n=1 Tax=Sinanodonta woodiana TaxID=1069815 RepID=A0ABD3WZG0_SINWO
METVHRLTLTTYILVLTAAGNRLENRKTQDDYLNICLDGQNHKSAPGPESDLMDKCKPWKNRSCCTKEVTELLHINNTWYNFDWNHCGQPLSDRCRARFIEDLCFYECSPNVGPWLVKVEMKVRNEKFMHVPLCETECNEWWEDCKNDLTCLKNWGRGFIWKNGTNECPKEAKCKSFQDVYDGAKDFCENVWDHSWKVVPDDDPAGCMVMWFDPTKENPNDAVAKLKVQMLVSGSVNLVMPSFLYQVLIFILFVLFKS